MNGINKCAKLTQSLILIVVVDLLISSLPQRKHLGAVCECVCV